MKFLDIFSGIGGFRIGMEMAGHECVGFCEFDIFARMSYTMMHLATEEQRKYIESIPTPLKKNGEKNFTKRKKELLGKGSEKYRNGEWFADDIRTVDARNIPRADIWCFGAPCQDFSIAGSRKGLDGDRSSLVREVFRIVGELKEEDRPQYLIYENVKGMLSSNKGWDFASILVEMEALGYDIEYQLLNSKEFGVPQNRERVFIIGHFGGRGGRKVFPIRETDGIYNSTGEDGEVHKIASCLTSGGNDKWNGDYIVSKIPISMTQKRYKEVDIANTLTAKGSSSGRGNYSPVNGAKVIPVLTPDRAEKRQNGRRFKEDGEPMFTLTSQDRHGVMIYDDTKSEEFGGNKFYEIAPTLRSERHGLKVCDFRNSDWNMDKFAEMMTSPPNPSKELAEYANKNNFRIRRLTPRECFRLQGVSDGYFDKAAAVNSDSQLYKQAGNMVTVNVIYEIAKRL